MLQDPTATVKDAAFTQARNGYSIRTDRWRYIEWEEGQQGAQLYNMDTDPAETTNLANDARHAQTVKDLRARLAVYRKPAGAQQRLTRGSRHRLLTPGVHLY
jgi:iduronate 2-sulfatase